MAGGSPQQVRYDNRDLYKEYAELRYRIGLVPQHDVTHTQLSGCRLPARRVGPHAPSQPWPPITPGTERHIRDLENHL
jgi:hypothetical protein